MATEVATLAGGCFWCLEAVFDQFQGVESVESGYMGGDSANPSSEDICTGGTGHAEVDPDRAVVRARDPSTVGAAPGATLIVTNGSGGLVRRIPTIRFAPRVAPGHRARDEERAGG